MTQFVRGAGAVAMAASTWAGSVRPKINRAFWAAMLLVHAPALLRSWRGLFGTEGNEAAIVGCVWLTLATLFFVLKVAGVPWLRFRTGRRSRLAILVAILLIHCGPLGVHLDGVLNPGDAPLLSTLLLAAGLDRVQQWWQGTPGTRSLPALRQPREGRVHSGLAVSPSRLSALIIYAPRPPPCAA